MDQGSFELNDRAVMRAVSRLAEASVKVVSFDIFDTLIARKVWDPEDIFVLMARRPGVAGLMSGERFDLVRAQAELSLRLDTDARGCDPTLAEIYGRLAELCDLSEEACVRLMRIEQDLELASVLPRPPLRHIWTEARRLGKEVILCSDMYLPRGTIERMLEGAGYGSGHRMFLSFELGVTKKHGTLYSFIANQTGHAPDAFLHLGDNLHADVEMAEAAGWRALHTPKVHERVFEGEANGLTGLVPAYRRNPDIRTFASRAALKLVTERLFSHSLAPRSDAGARTASAEDFGYVALGPLLLSLSLWLRRLATQRGQEHMLFLARDGWLPMAATRELDASLGPAFRSVYLPISRRMVFPWLLTKPMGFEKVAGIGAFPGLSVQAWLTERFGAAGMTVFQEAAGAEGEAVLGQDFQDHRDLVLRHLRENRSRLRALSAPMADRVEAFYRDAVPEGGATALFDVGRKGTFQRVLSAMTGRPIHGYYMMTSHDIFDNAPERNFDAFLGTIDAMARPRNPDTMAYEALLSERAGSYVGVGEDGEPLRDTGPRPAGGDADFERIQDSALAFVRDAVAFYGGDVHLLEQEPFYAAYAVENWTRNAGTQALFGRLMHEDPISTGAARSLSEALQAGGGTARGRAPLLRRLGRLRGSRLVRRMAGRVIPSR